MLKEKTLPPAAYRALPGGKKAPVAGKKKERDGALESQTEI